MSAVRHIGLVIKPVGRATVVASKLIELAQERGLTVVTESQGRDLGLKVQRLEAAKLAEQVDAIITIGGDGTFLHGARLAALRGVPLAGVYVGTLGFMTEFERSEIAFLLDLLTAKVPAFETRTMVQAAIVGESGQIQTMWALNEGIVGQSMAGRMISLRVAVDGKPLAEFVADGLIVATATGSTAYNFSAGGPLVHPSQSALILTPICTHMMSIRPLVIPPQSVVTVEVVDAPYDVYVTMDGQFKMKVERNNRIDFCASDRTLKVLKHPDRDFYSTLRQKLGWGTKPDPTSDTDLLA